MSHGAWTQQNISVPLSVTKDHVDYRGTLFLTQNRRQQLEASENPNMHKKRRLCLRRVDTKMIAFNFKF